MNQIDIIIIDEFEDEDKNQQAFAKLNLDTGWITDIVRDDSHIQKPWKTQDYEFSSGLLKLGAKELEFAVTISDSGQYQVSREELSEIKVKAANLVQNKKMKM